MQVCRFKNGEARADPLRLAYVIFPSRRNVPDLPLILLRRMMRELDEAKAPPTSSSSPPQPSTGHLPETT